AKPRFSERTGRRAPGEMPVIPLLCASDRRGDLFGNAREVLGDPFSRIAGRRGRIVRRRDLLRQGGYEFAGTPTPTVGTPGRAGGRGGVRVRKSETRSPKPEARRPQRSGDCSSPIIEH